MVSSNSTVSCVTMPICSRSDASDDIANVAAVDQDGAARHVVEPRQQVHERGLAGAAAADDRDHLPGAHGQRHAAQRAAAVAVVVAEETSRNSIALVNGGSGAAPGRSITSVCDVEHLEDALGGGRRLLQVGVDARQLLDRRRT